MIEFTPVERVVFTVLGSVALSVLLLSVAAL